MGIYYNMTVSHFIAFNIALFFSFFLGEKNIRKLEIKLVSHSYKIIYINKIQISNLLYYFKKFN